MGKQPGAGRRSSSASAYSTCAAGSLRLAPRPDGGNHLHAGCTSPDDASPGFLRLRLRRGLGAVSASSMAARSSSPTSWKRVHHSRVRQRLRRIRRAAVKNRRRREARMFQQAIRALPAALLEARLQRPDLLHHAVVAAWDGELAALRVEHVIHRHEQCGLRLLAAASSACQRCSTCGHSSVRTGRPARPACPVRCAHRWFSARR